MTAIVARRGTPGSEELRSLRATQARVASAPAHRDLAQVVAGRCGDLDPAAGIAEPASLLGPVTVEEAARFPLPAGAAMPPSVGRTVRLGRTGTPEELIATGIVPSAEVLAELVPVLTAEQVAASYPDPRLGRLMAATYQAFRRRRSLLLLDLATQVQFGELPWVRAVQPYASDARPDRPLQVARRVAALALDAFPATLLPNPLIQELTTLYQAAGVPLPLTEELAADIFMGHFSDKFRVAAQVAAEVLQGSLYARYYGVDYAEVRALGPTPRHQLLRRLVPRALRRADGETFGDLCRRDVPPGAPWSAARNGMIIERQQVITTQNLAVLVVRGGVRPTRSWTELAVAAGTRAGELLQRAQTRPRPLSTVKDAAYAWRQALFFLTWPDARRPNPSRPVPGVPGRRRSSGRWAWSPGSSPPWRRHHPANSGRCGRCWPG